MLSPRTMRREARRARRMFLANAAIRLAPPQTRRGAHTSDTYSLGGFTAANPFVPMYATSGDGTSAAASTWTCPDGTVCKRSQACKCSGCHAHGCGVGGSCKCLDLTQPPNPPGGTSGRAGLSAGDIVQRASFDPSLNTYYTMAKGQKQGVR